MKDMKQFKKTIILILIQAFLMSNAVFAGGIDLALDSKASMSTLSPRIAIDINAFRHSYDIYRQKRVIAEDIILPAGIISALDILETGTLVSGKTTNFKIGKNNFRVPPYLEGKVARLHVTAINSDGFEFQKMGVGVGRRKKTIAVVLVDIDNADNQLLIYPQGDQAILKTLDTIEPKEIIALGNKAQFSTMARQDSFLERSNSGINFLNRVLGIGASKKDKPRQMVNALNDLANTNPKLKKDLSVSLAFFSQDYMLTFSENLKKHSHIKILRDREQRGRFIAIVDKLNPDNRVVFERRGEDVYVLGENERVIISRLKKHKKVQTIYFTDLKEGAKFCKNVSRSLIEIDFAKNSHSMSMRKSVQLNVGAYNSDVSVLKVNQVTQATVTGNQIKKRAPELTEEVLVTYPVYLLRDDFEREISVDDIEIDYESSEFIFFNPNDIKKWPNYLSFGDSENAVYYQHVQGTYTHQSQDYVAYRAISNEDILGSLSFSNDGSFTIKGINWIDGKPVLFRNVKNIALSNIVTQLNNSKFIKISSVLYEHFDVTDFEAGFNPIRSTYVFKKGAFEQGENVNMGKTIDFSDIQKKQDKKIKKSRSFKMKIPKAIFIMSVFSIVLSAQSLFAATPAAMSFKMPQQYDFLGSLFAGVVLIAGIITYRVFAWVKKRFAPIDRVLFDRGRRDFIRTGSVNVLIGFLILQTGALAFGQIFSQLKDMRMEEKLRPAMGGLLTKLAIVYEQMPASFYAENKRLSFPMSTQFWQVFLSLSEKEAEKAASIYTKNTQEVIKMYSQPDMQVQNLNAAQLLRLIAARIQGNGISIQKRRITLPKKQDNILRINYDGKSSASSDIATGIAVASITPIGPVMPTQTIKREDKKKDPKRKSAKKHSQVTSASNVSLSDQAKLLSNNLPLLDAINSSTNEKGQTYFTLKSRALDTKETFTIREIETEEEIEHFLQLLGKANNFSWLKIFRMIESFKKFSRWGNRCSIFGVFILDEYGQETQIVGVSDYTIRDIAAQQGDKGLVLGHIEILPSIREKFSGVGTALVVKGMSDALTEDNLSITEGRVLFRAENKGNGNNSFKFYTEVLKLNPRIKANSFGVNEQTLNFDLTLEDVIEFLNREFNRQGFSKELKIKGVVSIDTDGLNKLDKNQKANMLVGQSI